MAKRLLSFLLPYWDNSTRRANEPLRAFERLKVSEGSERVVAEDGDKLVEVGYRRRLWHGGPTVMVEGIDSECNGLGFDWHYLAKPHLGVVVHRPRRIVLDIHTKFQDDYQ